jgi:site-specific recombinase XerD
VRRPATLADEDPQGGCFFSWDQIVTLQIRRLVYAIATAASLDECPSPHWLRHAHATHALERGAVIHLVQATLGHASVATTGRYLHARPTDSSARCLPV